jgi:hypothetical protein
MVIGVFTSLPIAPVLSQINPFFLVLSFFFSDPFNIFLPQKGSTDRQSQLHLRVYPFYCLLHVSVLVKSHHQSIKDIKKDNLNTTH